MFLKKLRGGIFCLGFSFLFIVFFPLRFTFFALLWAFRFCLLVLKALGRLGFVDCDCDFCCFVQM